MAINRRVVAKWKPSRSPDVKAQKLRWYMNGKLMKTVVLRFREHKRRWDDDNPHVKIHEGDVIQCMVCAVDEVGESDWVQAQVEYPYNQPDPPTDLQLEKVPAHLKVQ